MPRMMWLRAWGLARRFREDRVMAVLVAMRKRVLAGWQQGEYGHWYGHGPVCLVGAYRSAAWEDGGSFVNEGLTTTEGRQALGLVTRAIDPHYTSAHEPTIYKFNDAPETRKRDVLDVLDRAIEKRRLVLTRTQE